MVSWEYSKSASESNGVSALTSLPLRIDISLDSPDNFTLTL